MSRIISVCLKSFQASGLPPHRKKFWLDKNFLGISSRGTSFSRHWWQERVSPSAWGASTCWDVGAFLGEYLNLNQPLEWSQWHARDVLPLRLKTSCIHISASEPQVVKSAEIYFHRQEIPRLKCKCPTWGHFSLRLLRRKMWEEITGHFTTHLLL